MKIVWCIFLLVVIAAGTFLWHSRETSPGGFIFDNMRKQGELLSEPTPAKSLPASEEDLLSSDASLISDVKGGVAVYEQYCICCHGMNGDGKGAMAAYAEFPVIGAFWSDKYKDYPAEKIFRSIADGQGNMPSFSNRMTTEEIRKAVSRVIELKQCRGETSRKEEK